MVTERITVKHGQWTERFKASCPKHSG